jgi:hypothetical protein
MMAQAHQHLDAASFRVYAAPRKGSGMNNNDIDPVDFPSLSEIESARNEILSRVAASISGGDSGARAYHNSHSSGTGKGHSSVVTNRANVDDHAS